MQPPDDTDQTSDEESRETPTPTATATPIPATPQCNGGIDNDGDGAIDLRDSDCTDANDNDGSS